MHSVKTIFNKGMSFTADINGHKVAMDTTDEDGGSDSAPSPKKMMLAALAGCTGMDIVLILKKMKVKFSKFSINVDASLTKEAPKLYDHVRIIYSIKLTEKDRPKMGKAVQLSQDKYCGVSAMFTHFATIKTEIIYL